MARGRSFWSRKISPSSAWACGSFGASAAAFSASASAAWSWPASRRAPARLYQCVASLGSSCHRAVVIGQRLGQISVQLPGIAAIGVNASGLGIDLDGLAVIGNRAGVICGELLGKAAGIPVFRILRIEPHRFIGVAKGARIVAFHQPETRARLKGIRVDRRQPQPRIGVAQSAIDVALAGKIGRAPGIGVGELRAFQLSAGDQPAAGGNAGIGRDCPLKQVTRSLAAAGAAEARRIAPMSADRRTIETFQPTDQLPWARGLASGLGKISRDRAAAGSRLSHFLSHFRAAAVIAHVQKKSPGMPGDFTVQHQQMWLAVLAPLDLHDLVGLGAAGRDHFDVRALLLAEQRARQRRGDRDAAGLGVGFRLADDLPDLLLVGVLVDSVTVAPNFTVSPDSFETSITSARAILSSSSAMRPSLCDCASLAA